MQYIYDVTSDYSDGFGSSSTSNHYTICSCLLSVTSQHKL